MSSHNNHSFIFATFLWLFVATVVLLEFAADANIHNSLGDEPARIARRFSRNHDCRDGPCKQPGHVGTHLLAARTRDLAWLDAD